MTTKQISSPIEYWNDGKTRIISPEDENGRKIEIGYFFGVQFTGYSTHYPLPLLYSHYNPNAYSWLDVDREDMIRNVSVKKFTGGDPLDKHAITGTMFFRNKDIYLNSLSKIYEKNIRTNGEFYVDTLLNEAIDLGYMVKNFEVDQYICWGTPDDLYTYRYWQDFFNKVSWHPYDYQTDFFTN